MQHQKETTLILTIKKEMIMKTVENKKFNTLSNEEVKSVHGGYAPPTPEQLEALRKTLGPLADIVCW